MMETDALIYLPDDVMVKVDRAAMSCSLETRAPFPDHEIVELASRIPLAGKLGSDSGKIVLRENALPTMCRARDPNGPSMASMSRLTGGCAAPCATEPSPCWARQGWTAKVTSTRRSSGPLGTTFYFWRGAPVTGARFGPS